MSDATTRATESDCRICELATDDGRLLFARRWGDQQADHVFVVVHGLGQHSGCFHRFAETIATHRCATLAYDQHGHGFSPGKRGEAPSFQRLVDDIGIALTAAEENWPRARKVLLGHSMGGNQLLRYEVTRSMCRFLYWHVHCIVPPTILTPT